MGRVLDDAARAARIRGHRGPGRLLRTFCASAREMTGARYVWAGLLNARGDAIRLSHLSGPGGGRTRGGPPGAEAATLLREVTRTRRAIRFDHPVVEASALGLPPSVHPLLAIPIAAGDRVHGCACIAGDRDRVRFSSMDEWLARQLAVRLARGLESFLPGRREPGCAPPTVITDAVGGAPGAHETARRRAAAPGPRGAGSHRGRETLMLVEDEPTVRDLEVELLRGLGYQVVEAGDGREALDLLQAGRESGPDLLITDVVMPRLGGFELAARARELFPGMKVLYTSGYAGHAAAGEPPLSAAVTLLQKPFTPRELTSKVRALLDGPAG